MVSYIGVGNTSRHETWNMQHGDISSPTDICELNTAGILQALLQVPVALRLRSRDARPLSEIEEDEEVELKLLLLFAIPARAKLGGTFSPVWSGNPIRGGIGEAPLDRVAADAAWANACLESTPQSVRTAA